jgi:hypothetical protein
MTALAAAATVVLAPAASAADADVTDCGDGWSRTHPKSPGAIGTVLLDVAPVDTTTAWAVGYRAYVDDDGLFAVSSIIERWDGSAWRIAKKPAAQGQLAGVVAFGADDVWAVGHTAFESPDFQPLVMHWDGEAWSRVKTPRVDRAYLLAIGGVASDDLWAAGTLVGSGETVIMHWDGTRWSLVKHPQPTADYEVLSGVAARASDDVMIVGTYAREGVNRPLALHWDGTAWSKTKPRRVDDLGTALNDVAVTKSGAVWAVGDATVVGGRQPIAQRWTGRRWVVRSPSPVDAGGTLASVSAGSAGVWAVGSRTPTEGPTRTLAMRWRAKAHEWRTSHSPSAKGDSLLLAVGQSSAGELWSVGFHVAGEQQRALAPHRC